jgi:hypothetical protein
MTEITQSRSHFKERIARGLKFHGMHERKKKSTISVAMEKQMLQNNEPPKFSSESSTVRIARYLFIYKNLF